MARYIALLRFTEQGARTIAKSTARAAAFKRAAARAGVNIEAQYWTTGAYDGAFIFSAKDENAILRCVSSLAAAGNVRTESLRAFEAKEFDAFARK